jgi:thymidylate synthase
MFAQFYVSFPGARGGAGSQEAHDGTNGHGAGEGREHKPKGHLHCQLYQRSCGMGLGVPLRTADTHACTCLRFLVPGTFTHVMGDAHVYVDHVDALKVQLERDPRAFPILEFAEEREAKRGTGEIDGWKVEDFKVVGYEPHKGIVMKMSV